jgi:acyl-CoA synthetase (NDP forming)
MQTCQFLAEARDRGITKPLFVVPPFEATRNPEYRRLLEPRGIVVTSSAGTGYRCLKRLADFGGYDYSKIDSDMRCRDGRVSAQVRALTEYAGRKALQEYGVGVLEAIVAGSAEEAVAAGRKLGYPLAMKVSSVDIPHKTDAGGVVLNVSGENATARAYESIMANCRNYLPGADIEGVLIERMADRGAEFIIGVSNDAQFGPMLLVGMGGVFAEVFQDTALAPCPVSRNESLEMLKSLKSCKILTGYRGSPALDLDALADMMVRVSRYACDNAATLRELDINPIFVYEKGKGTAVADALIIQQSGNS